LAVAPSAKLFGTDGVRGVAGEFLTAELAFALGRAAAAVCDAPSPQVLVVRDTRVSGEMLEAALCAGVAAAGGQALLAGVLPTPAASILVRRYGFDLGVVISASHNPFRDNGIKFFDGDGRKLSDELEAAVEAHVHAGGARAPGASADTCGRVRALNGAVDDYLRELDSRFGESLAGRRVALDCANGATYRVAPMLFERLGAEVDAIGVEPDGVNINAGCGSTHMETLVQRVREGGHDVGFAFDGDGDRMLAVSHEGEVVDGDEIIAAVALDLKRRGELAGNGTAVTVMTNFGFHRAMREADIEVATTDVGDRHVVEELTRRGWVVGGEQSGHIVDMRLTPSGDGIAAALLLLQALGERRLASGAAMTKLPQVLTNVPVTDRNALGGAAAVWDAVEAETSALGDEGRVLVRPSGTEPVVRVMVEAPTEARCQEVCDRVAAVVERELGRGVAA
jgi:phosphoglucosamine mutase